MNAGDDGSHAVASGCDMPPQTPMVNIETFFNAVNEYYNK